PAPSYRVEVTHTVGADGVSVLADTVSPAPRTVAGNDYGWVLQLDVYGSEQQLALDSVLPDMAPGETRLVSEGTEVAYQLPSGWNQISLPPLYVTAANIVALAPAVQTAGAGGTVTYTVTLTNATTTDDVYTLDVAGLPEGWAQ